MFQDVDGNVFIIDDTLRPLMGGPAVSGNGDNILTLVDADAKSWDPNNNIFKDDKRRILLTSSPRKKEHGDWLTHRAQHQHAAFVMEPWSREEFVVASFVYSA